MNKLFSSGYSVVSIGLKKYIGINTTTAIVVLDLS